MGHERGDGVLRRRAFRGRAVRGVAVVVVAAAEIRERFSGVVAVAPVARGARAGVMM